jgi:hypothetical protein
MVRNRRVRNWRGDNIFRSRGGAIIDQYQKISYKKIIDEFASHKARITNFQSLKLTL